MKVMYLGEEVIVLVTIIVPCFNEKKNIVDTLNSIIENIGNYSDDIEFEIIVVDSSNDDTFKIIESSKYFKDDRFQFIHSKKKLFPGEARNKGIQKAKFDIIVFIDSGFSFEENWFFDLVTPLINKSEVDVVWGITQTADKIKKDRLFAYLFESKKSKRRVLPNMAIRKKIFYDGHWFQTDLRAVEDTKFIKEITGEYKEVFVNAKNYYSGHPDSLTAAFKKWSTYSFYSLKAGYYKKALFSFAQFLLYFAFLLILQFKVFFLFLVLAQMMRVIIKSNKNYRVNVIEFFYVVILSFFIDFGRFYGSLKGLATINFKNKLS